MGLTLLDFLIRLGAALLMGAAVGLERQWRQRMAGMRTTALVAAGASAFVMCRLRGRIFETPRCRWQIVWRCHPPRFCLQSAGSRVPRPSHALRENCCSELRWQTARYSPRFCLLPGKSAWLTSCRRKRRLPPKSPVRVPGRQTSQACALHPAASRYRRYRPAQIRGLGELANLLLNRNRHLQLIRGNRPDGRVHGVDRLSGPDGRDHEIDLKHPGRRRGR